MANGRVLPYTLANGPGNWPNATKFMALYNAVNDMFYVCTEAQLKALTPDTKTIYLVSDSEPEIAVRMYRADGWYNLPLSKMT